MKRTLNLHSKHSGRRGLLLHSLQLLKRRFCRNLNITNIIENNDEEVIEEDENSNELVSFSKAKDLLLRGENLKPNAFDDTSPMALDDNLLFPSISPIVRKEQ